MRYAILSSGSCSNAYIFEKDDLTFVVDNGLSCRKFEERCLEFGFHPGKINFIFLTHLHVDHLKGVELLSRKYQIPVVAHKNHATEVLGKKGIFKKLDVEEGREYEFRHLKFTPFRTSHDSPHSLGFYFSLDGFTFTLITDTGKVTEEMFRYARDSRLLFLEANYSPLMLSEGPYPPSLKKRISSNRGHLSNEEAGRFMTEVTSSGPCSLEHIHLCHLSQNNNTVEKVREEVAQVYQGSIPWTVCPRGEAVKGLDLSQKKGA
ncbi:MAG: MBL fold metallo-hydrolase [Spirochaetales bacterium]|nr:MBL fold metallo-hydrolase [Spirochaetales bacterium]